MPSEEAAAERAVTSVTPPSGRAGGGTDVRRPWRGATVGPPSSEAVVGSHKSVARWCRCPCLRCVYVARNLVRLH